MRDAPTRAGINASPDIPLDPLDWRPQRPRSTKIAPSIPDALLEPAWSGTHVLVHFDTQRPSEHGHEAWVRLVDEDGTDVTEEEPRVARAVAKNVLAIDAIFDGYLTDQATRTGEGASLAIQANVSRFEPLLHRAAEIDVVPARAPDAEETPVAFIAVDLLRLDGQLLLDLPLLERKRLLEGVIAPAELVRASVFARPPLGQWLASWKSAGFAGIAAKAANSRYRPGAATEEWTVYTKLR
jgi:ATP-dependent DNA ligase